LSARDITGSAPAERTRTGNVGGRGGSASGAPPALLQALQSQAGNRAVATLLAGGPPRAIQQAPAGTPAHAGDKPKPVSRAARFNDYAGLVNGFQELAIAVVNEGGHGPGSVRLGPDLSAAHRSLLEDVRLVLIHGQASQSNELKDSAAADWRSLAPKLKASFEESRKLGLRGEVIAAAEEDIALIGERYLHAKPKGKPSEVDSPDDFVDGLMAIQKLLSAYEDAGEGSLGMVREKVEGRPDAKISMATQDVNSHQIERLQAVKPGAHLTERHRDLVEKLRTAMILARSDTTGSAYRAVSLLNSIKGELHRVLTRARSSSRAMRARSPNGSMPSVRSWHGTTSSCTPRPSAPR
jgi:hypothetical protein